MMRNNKIMILLLSVICGIILFSFSGCGKKGPPTPPEIKGLRIAAPFDLKYSSGDKEISLSWDHRIDPETAFVKPEGFEIFMAKKTFESCTGCPFEFKKKGFVSMPAMKFSTPIEKGFKYYFRIRAIGNDDMKSEYSKTVQFEYK
ncbi:MAG: hypothetical protein GXP56_09125 [Deltaproteobacteria bacterium]|nr:hypothetical protein [Deltaproteobacteria bacterium]